MGSLLFLLYINGIFELNLNGTLLLYADDDTLVFLNTDIATIEAKLQEDLHTIADWLCAHKLSLNASKTKYMIIKSGGHCNHTTDIDLRMY